MSAKFSVFIPSQVLQIDKYFPNNLKKWLSQYEEKKSLDNGLYPYSLLTLPEFLKQPDVNSDLPDTIYHRYYVIDWGFYFPPSDLLRDLLSWLANIYIYGEVGLLKYWSDQLRRFPSIKIGEKSNNFSDLSVDDLPLDQLLFFSLKEFYELD